MISAIQLLTIQTSMYQVQLSILRASRKAGPFGLIQQLSRPKA